jgi:hypothetical protein
MEHRSEGERYLIWRHFTNHLKAPVLIENIEDNSDIGINILPRVFVLGISIRGASVL